MIIFTDLHNVTPNEFRVIATDTESGRSKVYPIFAKADGPAMTLLDALDVVKARALLAGLPPAYDAEADIAAMRAEYTYPNVFRKAP